ncbi:uncharacterized protein LOC109792187 [Cajanus cajan]|uniref:Retrotransposon Copia-like N-terminal domain-containing protein n=1 Tax=Cajanus cajan TaxID=3821 RepID=A0A151QVG4_CAJCA|nr:uncharacterized protein LOC109792187 [Cajanus cajan]KYP34300.1 hypothetical protein KK1_044768 [Cajanus cajan]
MAKPGIDPESPYYMHANESPGAILVSVKLNGENYHPWSRSMYMALKSKNKEQFIDGTIIKPPKADPMFKAWDRCNTMILSWLTHSLEPEITESVLWIDNALDVWKDLQDRYYQGDMFRISDLQETIYMLKQGDLTITAYYTQLKTLWQELDNFRPIPTCKCAVACNCDLLSIVRSYRENDYVIRFLKGLNEQYSSVRSNIMLMEPLPNITKVFSLLIQQERQFNSVIDDSKALAVIDQQGFRGRPPNRGGRAGRFIRGGRGHNSKVCTYCNKLGHTIETCYWGIRPTNSHR